MDIDVYAAGHGPDDRRSRALIDVNIDVEVKDLDKVVHAIGGELIRWYDHVNAEKVDRHKLPIRHPRVRAGTPLRFGVDQIDDDATLWFNDENIGFGNACSPILSEGEVRVRPGQNLLMLKLTNGGAHKWNFRMDVRPVNNPDPIFAGARGSDDGFGQVSRLFFFGFAGT